jgi:hypothetical protein
MFSNLLGKVQNHLWEFCIDFGHECHENSDFSCTALYVLFITVVFYVYLMIKLWILFDTDTPPFTSFCLQ